MHRSNSVIIHLDTQIKYFSHSFSKSHCLLKVRALLQHHHFTARSSHKFIPSSRLCKEKLANKQMLHIYIFSRIRSVKLLALSTGCQKRAGPKQNIVDDNGYY